MFWLDCLSMPWGFLFAEVAPGFPVATAVDFGVGVCYAGYLCWIEFGLT